MRRVSLLLIFALAGLLTTPAAGKKADSAASDSTYKALDLFARVINFVESNYVNPVKGRKLIYGAIRGLLRTLDPHTAFLPPEFYREMKIDTSGEFGGLGIEISVRRGRLIVVTPIEGTPAYRVGVKAGDQIVAIDGKATRKMTLLEAVRKMRGRRGTKVKLSVRRKGKNKPLTFTIVRDRIRIKSAVGTLLEPGYGYVRIKNFQDRTDAYLAKVLAKIKKKSGGKLKGLILDLRNNPGGLLQQAVRVADQFLARGLIVTTKGRKHRRVERRYALEKGTAFDNYPIIALINGGSASAAEIVAGALQDHKRAVVLGTPSFGKGSVQTVVELDDGEGRKVGLKLTIAKYYTPSGRSIQEEGIQPDIVLEAGTVPKRKGRARRREKDLERHFKAAPKKNDQKTKKKAPKKAPAPAGAKKEPLSKKAPVKGNEAIVAKTSKAKPAGNKKAKKKGKGSDRAKELSKLAERVLKDLQVKTALDHIKAYRILVKGLGGRSPLK